MNSLMTRLRRDRNRREDTSLHLSLTNGGRLRRLRRIVGLRLHLGTREQRHHGNLRRLRLLLRNGADEHQHDNLDHEEDGSPRAGALQQLRHERQEERQERRLVETARLGIGVRRTNAQSIAVVVETAERENGLQRGVPLSSVRVPSHELVNLASHILQRGKRVGINRLRSLSLAVIHATQSYHRSKEQGTKHARQDGHHCNIQNQKNLANHVLCVRSAFNRLRQSSSNEQTGQTEEGQTCRQRQRS